MPSASAARSASKTCCPTELWSLVPTLEALLASWPCQAKINESRQGATQVLHTVADAVRVRRAGCRAYEFALRPAFEDAVAEGQPTVEKCAWAIDEAARRLGAVVKKPFRLHRPKWHPKGDSIGKIEKRSPSFARRWQLNASAAHTFLRHAAGGPAKGATALCITGQARTLAFTACALRSLLVEPLGADIFIRLESSTPRAAAATAARLLGPDSVQLAAAVPSVTSSQPQFPGARCYIGKRPRTRYHNGSSVRHLDKGRRQQKPAQQSHGCSSEAAPGLSGVLAMWSHWQGCMRLVRRKETQSKTIRQYKWVAFARTDWQMFAPLPVAAAARLLHARSSQHSSSGSSVAVPLGENYDGVNDRFALATRRAADLYGSLRMAVFHEGLLATSDETRAAEVRAGLEEWNSEQALHLHLASSDTRVVELPIAAATLRAPGFFGYPAEMATCCAVLAAQLQRDGDGRRIGMGAPSAWAASLLRGSCCPPAHAEAFIRKLLM